MRNQYLIYKHSNAIYPLGENTSNLSSNLYSNLPVI